VPETILSRCQEFEFRTIALQKIFDRLKIIADAEKIDIASDALREIARSGQGSMRDAQSNFDQVISFSGESITIDDVANALGFASVEMLKRVVESISSKNSKAILDVVEEIVARGQDMRNFCRDLLGLFRDLLVLKVADESENLLESAAMSQDELRWLAEPFSAADLVRFFNSLSETESKLREAAESRYLLEIGLVRLVEMQRVVPVETILDRLARLETSLSSGALPEPGKQAAAAPEKKTLASEIKHEKLSPAIPEELELPDSQQVTPEVRSNKLDFSFLENAPVRLPPISAEDLEHVDDPWLDAAFESKLMSSGDDLGPIQGSSEIIAALVGTVKPETIAPVSSSNGSAAVAVRTFERPDLIPGFDNHEEPTQLPELSENPTEEELLEYAHSHPVVKQALRIFRGKIVEIRKNST
jgi:DNA polymerase-3 subunit gamma/tau